ncbi:MAG TPA: TraR/DksA C4-type zinc finger protein [Thermodesulfobacteriota bacterium]
MDTEEFRRILLDRRREVLSRIGRAEEDLVEARESAEIESEEWAQEDLIADDLLSLDERSRDELLAINAALQRIADGTYGLCKVCGGPIPEARLRAMPTATTDVEHADEEETTAS